MLTDTEAASKSELTCKLESVEADVAKVSVEGTVEGATAGSTGTIEIHGFYLFDIRNQRLTQGKIEQKEKRTIGTVSPGLDVTAKVVVEHSAGIKYPGLTEEDAAKIPLDPPPELLKLRFRAAWNVEFLHDRDWHVFQQFPTVAVLRRLEKGTFVAQCNLAPVRQAAPGSTSRSSGSNDIKTSLGKRLKKIESAETIPCDDKRFIYRVTVRESRTTCRSCGSLPAAPPRTARRSRSCSPSTRRCTTGSALATLRS